MVDRNNRDTTRFFDKFEQLPTGQESLYRKRYASEAESIQTPLNLEQSITGTDRAHQTIKTKASPNLAEKARIFLGSTSAKIPKRVLDDNALCNSTQPLYATKNHASDDTLQTGVAKAFDPLAYYYDHIAKNYLRTVGLLESASSEAQVSFAENKPPKLVKETVTHNGSCGSNSLAIGFCIAVLEGQLSARDENNYNKLHVAWNATYPNNTKANASELFAWLRESLKDCNTQDMEDLLSPVIRVYIGIALGIIRNKDQANGLVRGDDVGLSEDEGKSWSNKELNGLDLEKIKESIGRSAENTVKSELSGDYDYSLQADNILSYKYYLDESQLTTIATELLGVNFSRAKQIEIDPEKYLEIDSKVQKSDDISCYRIENDEANYSGYIGLKHVIKTKFIYQHDAAVSEFIRQQTGESTSINLRECKEVCSNAVMDAIEKRLLLQLKDGNKILSDDDAMNDARLKIHVMHSNEIYWDVLLPEHIYSKYSRNVVTTKKYPYTVNNKWLLAYLSATHDIKDLPDFCISAAPFLNLSPAREGPQRPIQNTWMNWQILQAAASIFRQVAFVLHACIRLLMIPILLGHKSLMMASAMVRVFFQYIISGCSLVASQYSNLGKALPMINLDSAKAVIFKPQWLSSSNHHTTTTDKKVAPDLLNEVAIGSKF